MQTNDGELQVDWPANFNEVPKDIFFREDVYKREIKRIFQGPEWHAVAHIAEIPERGNYKTSVIGEMPIFIMHGDDGIVRVFENSCTHRGTQLATCPRGAFKEIECPYHRWVFNNCGALLSASGSRDFPENFEKSDYNLRELRSANVYGVIFATCSKDAPDIDTYLGDAKEQIASALGGDGRLKLMGYQKVRFLSNWKEYADNEGYHAPLLHGAFRLLQWQGGKGGQFMTDYAHKVINTALTIPKSGFLKDHSLVESRDTRISPRSVVISLFPVTIILSHLDVINVRYAFPISPDETEVHYAYFSHESDSPEVANHRLRQASNLLGPSGLISLEDGAVFNRLHVGARTGGKVAFQKGVSEAPKPPYVFNNNDEAGNLVRWNRYREAMGFAHA